MLCIGQNYTKICCFYRFRNEKVLPLVLVVSKVKCYSLEIQTNIIANRYNTAIIRNGTASISIMELKVTILGRSKNSVMYISKKLTDGKLTCAFCRGETRQQTTALQFKLKFSSIDRKLGSKAYIRHFPSIRRANFGPDAV